MPKVLKPVVKPSTKAIPAKTERTHEENQERAYIAASRRSDRSLEARCESARRASEIHKSRTGRSLRVREQDVQNEEMYEEEDDDMPMHYRRVSAALYGGQSFPTPFDQRVSTWMSGQTGIRSALHHAIYQANQTTEQHRIMNQYYQQQQQRQYQHPQNPQQQQQQPPSGRNTSMVASPSQSTPQPCWSPQMTTPHPSEQAHVLAMRAASEMQLTLPVRAHALHRSNASPTEQPSHPIQYSPQQMPTPRSQNGSQFDDSDPFSTTLPLNQQQLLDGNPSLARRVHPSQMTRDVPMPSTYNYHFEPHAKENNQPGSEQFAFGQRDLSQTLAPQQCMQQHVQAPPAQRMPTDTGSYDATLGEIAWTENDFFNYDQNNMPAGQTDYNGQVTPGDTAWNPEEFEDFFNFPPDSSAPE